MFPTEGVLLAGLTDKITITGTCFSLRPSLANHFRRQGTAVVVVVGECKYLHKAVQTVTKQNKITVKLLRKTYTVHTI